MRPNALIGSALGLLIVLALFTGFQAPEAVGEEKPEACVDKALCAEMLRHGQEAYQRGKYLDAKEYFRKAVQADPNSTKAWAFYDMAAVFALAEKVEQNADLIMPGVSTRQEETAAGPAESPPPPKEEKKEKEKETEFVIIQDEGC